MGSLYGNNNKSIHPTGHGDGQTNAACLTHTHTLLYFTICGDLNKVNALLVPDLNP